MAKKTPSAPAERVELYDKLITTLPDQERKGATSAYTSLNGHMFSFVDKSGEFAFRFSEEEKKALMEELGAKESIQHNSIMKGYIIIPESFMDDFDKLSELFKQSYEYISSLKPKPTKKKKKLASKSATK